LMACAVFESLAGAPGRCQLVAQASK